MVVVSLKLWQNKDGECLFPKNRADNKNKINGFQEENNEKRKKNHWRNIVWRRNNEQNFPL